jgi:CheY-like chemotaxis protein
MNSRRKPATVVVVVDDQEILRLLMCKTLESGGFRVLQANNGADALSLFRSVEPPVDLLVTDYRMPVMTGLVLARECCSFSGELNVLYISGSSPGDALQTELMLARRSFLAKPFRQSDLLRNAKTLLDTQLASAPYQVTHGSQVERLSMER